MKIVVTGALGHIGSRLVRALPLHVPVDEICMIDNLSTQRFPSLFDLPNSTRYHFLEGDVRTLDLKPIVEGASAVVQLAAITDATSSFERQQEVESNNKVATAAVAKACTAAGVPLIHLSSTSVYGSQAQQVDEDCPLSELKPQSPYAETKLQEEQLVSALAKDGLRAISCRFGTIFGTSPGMRFHTAVNKFCWQAAMKQPITVWKTAYEQRRPYLDLEDAVRAIAFLIKRDLFDGRIYNVVTLNATVRDVVDHIRAFVPDLAVEFVESRIMNQLSYDVADTRLAAAGFRPEGDLCRGVKDTIMLLRNANK